MKEQEKYFNKGARTYLDSALKATSHPVRRDILQFLKDNKSHSTVDLLEKLNIEKDSKENRYNLYHHIKVLVDVGLIKQDNDKSDGRLRYYKLKQVEKPSMLVFNFNQNEIKKNKIESKILFNSIEKIENYKLPNRKKISKVEIHITYNWVN